jgi:hypothetical protein
VREAIEKQWLADEFEARLANPPDVERVTRRNAGQFADRIPCKIETASPCCY